MLEIRNPDQKLSMNFNTSPKRDIEKDVNRYEPIARILVIGVGGAGNNAINRMIEDNVLGVEFVAVNTDKQDLSYCKAPIKIAIGEKLTGGRGCGALPEVGEAAANESKEAIRNILRENNNQKKADMVFITCGMGGGTGTGAAPIIASLAKEEGILTVSVVTKPFRFEGKRRMTNALTGINKLFPNVDTMIVIPNDKLFQVVDAKDGFRESFAKADEILKQSIRGITDLINLPALVNLDFADIATVMRQKGIAHIAVGEGSGEDKVNNAIKKAIESPLLETTIDGATDMIVCISGQVSLMDVDAAMREIEPKLNPDVNIIFGAREDQNAKDSVSITLIATGIRDTNSFNNYNTQNRQNIYNNAPINQQMPNMPNMQQMPNMQRQAGQNFNMNIDYQNIANNNSNNNIKNNQERGFSSLFSPKKSQNENNIKEHNDIVNANSGTSHSIDSLNVDLSKIDFAKKNDDSNNLLPNFITDSFKNKK